MTTGGPTILDELWTALEILASIAGGISFLFTLYMRQHYVPRAEFFREARRIEAETRTEQQRIEDKLDREVTRSSETINTINVKIEQQNSTLATLNERSAAHTRPVRVGDVWPDQQARKSDRDISRILDCLLDDRPRGAGARG